MIWQDEDNDEYHINKMKNIKNLGDSYPTNSRLFRFVADSPTVTTQRVAALTSGGIPAFHDVLHSFQSDSVKQDNIVSQLNVSLVALGDEVWSDLFPNSLLRGIFFPSLDIKDLDTVDDGILDNFWDEAAKSDWKVLVAHFLGVDHVGHKHQVKHPEMKRKLIQMDDFVQKVADWIDDDTLLLVFGDHGQTDDGAHGGNQDMEVNSALFAYSKTKQFFNGFDNSTNMKDIPQINLVATLAFLLNFPIPFENLGQYIPELIPKIAENDTTSEMVRELLCHAQFYKSNCFQVHQYLMSYSNIQKKFRGLVETNDDWIRLTELENKLKNTISNKDEDKIIKIAQEYIQAADIYLKKVNSVCRAAWNGYDFVLIGFGLINSLLVCTLALFSHWSNKNQSAPNENQSTPNKNQSAPNKNQSTPKILFIIYTIFVLSIWVFIALIGPRFSYKIIVLSIITVFPFIYIIKLYDFNISYIKILIYEYIYEILMLTIICICPGSDVYSIRENTVVSFVTATYLSLIIYHQWLKKTISSKTLILVTFLLILQGRVTPFLDPLNYDSEGNRREYIRHNNPVTAAICIISYLLCIRRFPSLFKCETAAFLNVKVKYIIYINWILVGVYFVLQTNSDASDINHWIFETSLWNARLIYLNSSCLFFKLLYIKKKNNNFIGQYLLLIFCPVILILVGSDLSLQLLNILVRLAVSWQLRKSLTRQQLHFLLFLILFSSFFDIGQRMTIQSFPITAAFVGVRSFHVLLSGVLTIIRLYGPMMIYLIIIPILTTSSKQKEEKSNLGLNYTIFCLCLYVRHFVCEVFSVLLREHLMNWAVFAPKLIYDCSATIVLNIFLLIIFAIAEYS
eukprot:GHVL01022344.1.p1 GENE.GHVL01022344.1~~GHVL01022344.1.p1  ORF type:complete len:850 (+),score=154.45 GHVL01022344.1:299-2848(+)